MRYLYLIPLVILYSNIVSAIGIMPNETQILIKGTAVIPPCEINNKEDIIIDFGTVSIKKVKQGNVSKSKSIFISCDTETPISLLISGTTTDKKNSLLTDLPGLSIAHFSGGPLELNEPFSVKNNSFLVLETRLETSDDFDQHEAEFTVSSVLKVLYQ